MLQTWQNLWSEVKYFWSHKCFAIGIPLMMAASYITLLLNPTIGIDDTSFSLYYEDGVSPAMGRWGLYVINKVLPLDYNPHFVEAVGLAFFCLSITLWCVVFYRMFGDRLSVGAYTLFGMVMLSSPIISEVVIWYLQDGIYLGYGFTALAVLFGMELFGGEEEKSRGKKSRKAMFKWWGNLALSAIMLVTALGFYEAFMIVFLMAMVMNFMLIRVLDKQDYCRKPLIWLRNMLVLGVCAMALRSLVINGITVVDGLQEQATVLESRGLGDILGLVTGWFDGTRSVSEFTFVLKDFFVKYYLHAIVYTPIMILVLAVGVLGLWSIVNTARKKDFWILAAGLGVVLLPWVMPILEGWATYYRASQYVPLLTAFAVLTIAWEIRRLDEKSEVTTEQEHAKKVGKCAVRSVVKAAAFVCAFVLLYRQGYEMNRWLYVDAMKYENDKLVMSNIALDIMETCDTSKPICIIGSYETPEGLIHDVYVPQWSKKYAIVSALVKAVDEEIFDKYDVEGRGYATAETPQLSMINWGTYAYRMPGQELIKFWKMHGFDFRWDNNNQHRDAALIRMEDAPAWPKEGSIVEMEDHIIVNLGY